MNEAGSAEHGHDHPKHELSHYAKRIYAIRDLLIEKGVISDKDIQCQVEYQEARSPANGAKQVARAGVDAEFKSRYIAKTKTASPPAMEAIFARSARSQVGLRRNEYRCDGDQ